MPNMVASVYAGGWPKDPGFFDNVDTVLIYCDGADGHLGNLPRISTRSTP